jgi:hypothetical protein
VPLRRSYRPLKESAAVLGEVSIAVEPFLDDMV